MASSLRKPDLLSFEGNVPENLRIFFLEFDCYVKVKICELQESAENAQKELQQEAAVCVVKQKRFNKDTPPTHDKHEKDSSKCKFCGNNRSREKCPAYGKTCAKCGKRNHFATVCKSSDDSTPSLRHSKKVMKWNTSTKTPMGEILVTIQTATTT